MVDPLEDFDWQSLYQLYDKKCRDTGRFNPDVPALACFSPRLNSDRYLYYALLKRVANERSSRELMSLSTYESVVYWKMYSTSLKINSDLRQRSEIREKLKSTLIVLKDFPERIEKLSSEVLGLVRRMLALRLYGMRLPVCTTVLHFMYPGVIPIFDQMILRAVGYNKTEINQKQLNQLKELYAEYLEHHWSLVNKYLKKISGFQESPIRIIEMALWVKRGEV